MLKSFKLFLPNTNREVKIDVYIPLKNKSFLYETMYFLDGQNAFYDDRATYGTSIGATKILDFATKELKKPILGVAVYNTETDFGRTNEYSPFKIDTPYEKHIHNDPICCKNFCKDFISTIIPFIENNFNTYKEETHRFIYGSSLGAIAALYLGLNYKNSFSYIGSFSTAGFLFEKDFFRFLDTSTYENKNIFLYIGKKESSDTFYDSSTYYNTSVSIYNLLKTKKVPIRFVVDENGKHCEATWGNHLIDFLNFIHNKEIVFYL